MNEKLLRAAWMEVDLDAVRYNARNIKKLIGKCEPLAVMKADAYGLGAPKIAEVLKEEGYKNFAVATLEEALELRKSGVKDLVLVLGIILGDCAEEAVKNDITVMISSYDNAKDFSDEAVKQGKTVKCFVALDTGMSRIGYNAEDLDNLVKEVSKLKDLPGLELYGLHSHFAVADEADKEFTYLQLDRFKKADEALRKAGIEIPVRMIANSAAITDIPESLEYEMCRPGFILYGIYPSDDVCKEKLPIKPAMSVKARITYIKTIKPGDTVGYGRAFKAEKETKVATLPLGFADGLSRAYSPYGKVIVGGKKVNILGNICMDQCMIDITDVPNVKVGDEVIIMGTDGVNTITAEDIIEHIDGVLMDEVMGNFAHRMPRIYKSR